MLLMVIGALLGAVYGWVYHYWLPSSGWGLIVWGVIGGLAGWAYASDAEGDEEDGGAAAFAGLIVGAIFAVAVGLIASDVRAASLGAFLGFFGGVTVLYFPAAAVVGGLLGLLIGVVDVAIGLFRGDPLAIGGALRQVLSTGAIFFILIPLIWSRYGD